MCPCEMENFACKFVEHLLLDNKKITTSNKFMHIINAMSSVLPYFVCIGNYLLKIKLSTLKPSEIRNYQFPNLLCIPRLKEYIIILSSKCFHVNMFAKTMNILQNHLLRNKFYVKMQKQYDTLFYSVFLF